MNRILKYNGKTIKEMSLRELENQYKMNKSRMIYRTVFFIIIALLIIAYEPAAVIIPVALAIITGYWLVENNKSINEEIQNR